MRFYSKQHKYYCGVDLHAKTMYVCIIDQEARIVKQKNIKCHLRIKSAHIREDLSFKSAHLKSCNLKPKMEVTDYGSNSQEVQ